MTKIECYKTADGKIHTDYISAFKYADNAYGDRLLTLAKQLVVIDKYQAMTDFLDKNLEAFTALYNAKNDALIIEEEE